MYHILGVSRNAQKNEIKAAFKKLALQYHPDKNNGNKQYEEKFKLINEAYQTLSDDAKRAAYNQKWEYYQFHIQKSFSQSSSSTYQRPTAQGYTYSHNYSEQGRHYTRPVQPIKDKKSDYYFLAITLFVIIATASLLFGFLMNNIAAKEHYKKAVIMYEAGNYSRTLFELDKALSFNDKFADAYILRGDAKVKLQSFESALADFRLGIYYHGGNPKPEWLYKMEACKKMLELD